MKIFQIALVLLGLLMLNSCGDNEANLISIDEYITNNNLTVQETASGLKYIVLNTGSIEKPSPTSTVTVKYTGYRTDEFIFDFGEAVTFSLENVIQGWQEGIPLFGKGGRGTLYIPSNLGYGSESTGSDIPANTDLIFDIEVLDF